MNENLDIDENEEGNNEGDEYEPDNYKSNGNQMRMSLNRFITAIIRYQVSDVGAAEIASSLLIDLGLVSDTDRSMIID